jgi:hypothetical protein
VHGGRDHTFSTERVTYEPFNLRAQPRHALVIDRLAHWYTLSREWLKKVALMDDVYLLNNPFTFQAMTKHSAYCAMMRLGLKVPDTWMVPHKVPPDDVRFPDTSRKYNLPFDLADVGEQVGYPLFMKPFDGGAWVGVTRISDRDELRRHYDDSGERLMHLQASVEGFDVFARSLSIGAETLVVRFDPDRPMFDRYQVSHGFLTPELGREVVVIGRVINAFFRWEFNSCECLVRGDEVHPIDYANAAPDLALTSLHYYFPWAIKSLLKWSIFCCVTERPMRVDQDMSRYFDIGDDGTIGYEEKLARYDQLADEYFETDRYNEFCAEHLAEVDEAMVDYVRNPSFDHLLVETVRKTFPAHEHDAFVAHYRGLLRAWADDQVQ